MEEPHEAPLKLHINDLKKISKNTDKDCKWKITFGAEPFKKIVAFNYVWVQGFANSVVNDEMIRLWDPSGEVVVRCEKIHEDKTWLRKGVYCGVIGILFESDTDSFTLVATRLLNLTQQQNIHQELWPYEVGELANVLCGRIANPLNPVP